VCSVFRVCDYERANKHDYCTLSVRGLTRFRSDDDTEFLPLDIFAEEYVIFLKIIKVLQYTSMYKIFHGSSSSVILLILFLGVFASQLFVFSSYIRVRRL